jgi:hypothetical protein
MTGFVNIPFNPKDVVKEEGYRKFWSPRTEQNRIEKKYILLDNYFILGIQNFE